jgi:hypothetical protein
MPIPNTFGFTRRDVARIKALAESVTDLDVPAALADLDAPYRVQALPQEMAGRSNGTPFGAWAGRVLVYWVREGR